MLEFIEKYNDITKTSPEQIGPLKLAYLGDAVYELIIRTALLDPRERSVKKLNKAAQSLVNAETQASIARVMEGELTEEERAVYHRGRNAKSQSVSKHADIQDYRVATGLETLYGYWYLKGDMERAVMMLRTAMDRLSLKI